MFLADGVRFAQYSFAGASVHPSGVLPVARIRDADPSATPPEIRTVSGETLFVDASLGPDLSRFCERHGIPLVTRLDVWGNLLEPFLDTEFTASTQETLDGQLVAAGFTVDEISAIRARLEPLMVAYNIDSGLWDWVYLGLYDLLRAANGTLVPPSLPPTLGDPTKFYHWAMELADR